MEIWDLPQATDGSRGTGNNLTLQGQVPANQSAEHSGHFALIRERYAGSERIKHGQGRSANALHSHRHEHQIATISNRYPGSNALYRVSGEPQLAPGHTTSSSPYRASAWKCPYLRRWCAWIRHTLPLHARLTCETYYCSRKEIWDFAMVDRPTLAACERSATGRPQSAGCLR